MSNQRNIAEVSPTECSPLNGIELALKVHPYHTDSLMYSLRERSVYHDRSDCGYGQRVKRDGNTVPGTADRQLCRRCADLNAGVDDFYPGDAGE
ncbi:MAG: hypothetical protein ACHQ4F_12935 [Candidatus Dormibacteria bacterium]